MPAATPIPRDTPIHLLGRLMIDFVTSIGNTGLFTWALFSRLFGRLPRGEVLWPSMMQIGVQSIPVVLVTGLFIGMVLAVQTFDQLRIMHLESRIGSVINISLVKELGPVLAATMLAGRVGSAIAAELGTMRVTEQIDALRALGADPIRYLVVPRFLACSLLIPTLTLVADGVGMIGGWFFSTQILGVNSYYYWMYTDNYIGAFEVISGVCKSCLFGAAIAIMACHRGFKCGAGAEGVGRAATEAFVYSFIAILMLDFLLGVFLSNLYSLLWPNAMGFV